MTPDAVFIVDDDEAMRDSLRWLLEPLGFDVHCFASAAEFLAAAFLAALRPPGQVACLVTDVRMPGMSGLELHEAVQRQGLALPVIIITGHGDVPMAVRAMRAGAVDFIEKPLNNQILIERINEALRLARAQAQDAAAHEGVRARFAALTPRERQVAQGVAHGQLNKVIAHTLGISPKTVEIHRASAMSQLSAQTAADLARILSTAGLLGESTF